MTKQRVKVLGFRVSSDNETTYVVAGSREFTTLYGRFRLEQDSLAVWPDQDFENAESAVEQVTPFLQAWEIRSGLDFGPGSLRFTYASIEFEQLGSPLGTGDCASISGLQSGLLVGVHVATHVTRHAYPLPPENNEFATSEYLALAYHRWRNYVLKKEPLPSLAYFIYTIFEQLGGGRKSASSIFEIDYAVLDTMARLSSISGDAESMRKFAAGKPPAPMQDAERAWLEDVVKRLIRRLGEYAAAAPLVRIAMADFRALP